MSSNMYDRAKLLTKSNDYLSHLSVRQDSLDCSTLLLHFRATNLCGETTSVSLIIVAALCIEGGVTGTHLVRLGLGQSLQCGCSDRQ